MQRECELDHHATEAEDRLADPKTRPKKNFNYNLFPGTTANSQFKIGSVDFCSSSIRALFGARFFGYPSTKKAPGGPPVEHEHVYICSKVFQVKNRVFNVSISAKERARSLESGEPLRTESSTSIFGCNFFFSIDGESVSVHTAKVVEKTEVILAVT